MTTARLLPVAHCASCPFSYSSEDDDEWTCTATDDDGGFKVIKRVQKRRGGPWLPPPMWCPLRTEVVVVTLDLKKKRSRA